MPVSKWLRRAMLAALFVPVLAAAQAWPTRPVRLVSPFPAGGGTDAFARPLATILSQQLGQQFVIDNRGGAGGTIGAEHVAKGPADGYTFLVGAVHHTIAVSVYSKLGYELEKDLVPVTLVAIVPNVVVVHPKVPVQSIKELIAYAKANPEALTFGSGSSSSRIAGEMLKTLAGIDMTNVPYKSNPQAVTDLLGEQISLVFADISTTLPQAKAGKVKALAVSSAKRSPLAPDLPTMAEAGVPGYDLTAWFAAFVPARTPKPIVDKLNAAIVKAVADKTVQEALLKAGIEPETGTPDQLRSFVEAETKKWGEIVKAANIQPE